MNTAFDPIHLPPLCYSEFKCTWACDNMVGVENINVHYIINPSTYEEDEYNFEDYINDIEIEDEDDDF